MLDRQGIGMTSQRTRNRLVTRLYQAGIKNEAVLKVMAHTPRHLFVEEALASRAYEDTALPIGYGQTISHPYTVARMTELLLDTQPIPQKILEIGTGSGYQAAVLAGLVQEVYSVERIAALHERSKRLLKALDYANIYAYLADGSWGLEAKAPFDAIIVTAAPDEVPQSLLEQLSIGGQLIIPVGQQQQVLQVIKRLDQDHYQTNEQEFVYFVPLVQDKPR
jgi:protein-L-isoaspartate(D-aspartate) O-methyltransferase